MGIISKRLTVLAIVSTIVAVIVVITFVQTIRPKVSPASSIAIVHSSQEAPPATVAIPKPVERVDPELVASTISAEYPIVKRLSFDCNRDRCSLRGRINPPADINHQREAALFTSQVAAILAGLGYKTSADLSIDMVADQTVEFNQETFIN